MATLMGLAQWFCLLNRPLLSVFNAVYVLSRQQPDSELMALPAVVRNELLLFACLSVYVEADLNRTWHGTLLA
jgi:hypothetical protein